MWLDPQRGWEPVRVTFSRDGEIQQEMRASLRNYDGVWYPESVALFIREHKAGREPMETIRIHYALFNQPDQPTRLTPKDIGIEAGANVHFWDENHKPIEMMTWDGEKPVPVEEFERRLSAGEVRIGPGLLRIQAKHAAEQAAAYARQAQTALQQAESAEAGADASVTRDSFSKAPPDRIDSLFEQYTRWFMARYRLDDEQTQKAWVICRESEARARGLVARHRREIVELDTRLKEASSSRAGDADETRARLNARRAELLEPIVRLFEQEFKPRLERLLTRAQRERARTSSSPAP